MRWKFYSLLSALFRVCPLVKSVSDSLCRDLLLKNNASLCNFYIFFTRLSPPWASASHPVYSRSWQTLRSFYSRLPTLLYCAPPPLPPPASDRTSDIQLFLNWKSTTKRLSLNSFISLIERPLWLTDLENTRNILKMVIPWLWCR